MRSEAGCPGFKLPCPFYAESVVANAFSVSNNPFGVAHFLLDELDPG